MITTVRLVTRHHTKLIPYYSLCSSCCTWAHDFFKRTFVFDSPSTVYPLFPHLWQPPARSLLSVSLHLFVLSLLSVSDSMNCCQDLWQGAYLLFLLSPRTFMVSGLTFKSLIHFEALFVYSMTVVQFHSFCMWLSNVCFYANKNGSDYSSIVI